MTLADAGPPAYSAADPGTITESLARQSADLPLVHLDDDLRPVGISFGELRERAELVARSLRHRFGIGPGDVVCLHSPTSLDCIAAIFGSWRAGATVTMLPTWQRGDPSVLHAMLDRRIAAARAALVLADRPTVARLAGLPALSAPIADFGALSSSQPGPAPAMPAPDQIALLQFTSGTTAVPRAVAVRHHQVLANTRPGFGSATLPPGSGFVSWLPLYHDMGIITLAGALAYGHGSYTMDPQTFSMRPTGWLNAIASYRAAITAAPNFGYHLASQLLSMRGRHDLSSLRVAWNGAEPIDAATLGSFVDIAQTVGMPRTAMCPSYGLAEATLVVTLGRDTEQYRTLTVDRAALAAGVVQQAATGRTLVDCGTPIPDTVVTITDPDGAGLPDGEIGSIRVTGPCVIEQYWTRDGSQPGSLLDHTGRLVTGDLGFTVDGRLYVCGRHKDMIIVGGRNLYPEDVESTTERVRGVRQGNVVAFALPGSENLVVVAETTLREGAAHQLVRTISDALHAELAYLPHDVVLVAAGTLPKTTSGKRQRLRCREQYQDASLAVRASLLAGR